MEILKIKKEVFNDKSKYNVGDYFNNGAVEGEILEINRRWEVVDHYSSDGWGQVEELVVKVNKVLVPRPNLLK